MRIRELIELLKLRNDKDQFKLGNLPKKINYKGDIYKIDEDNYTYYRNNDISDVLKLNTLDIIHNTSVDIVEENITVDQSCKKAIEYFKKSDNIEFKFNEIIDVVNKLMEEKDD